MNLSKFAENLNDLMFERNMNQKQLAEKLKITHSSVTRYLKGTREPTVTAAVKLADFFDVSLEFLLAFDTDSHGHGFGKSKPLGEQIKKLVESNGLTGYEFCKKCKIANPNYYYWVNGTHEPSVDNLKKIADYFNLTMDCVLGREK